MSNLESKVGPLPRLKESAAGLISVEKTDDMDYVSLILCDSSMRKSMIDDSCQSDVSKIVDAIKKMPGFFLSASVNNHKAGIWWLRWISDSEVEAHTALLPACRGRSAIIATKEAISWVFENTQATKISSYAFSDSPKVDWFCRAVGMSQSETKDWPNTRDGKPVKITYFTINK